MDLEDYKLKLPQKAVILLNPSAAFDVVDQDTLQDTLLHQLVKHASHCLNLFGPALDWLSK